jgi:hypothetical protein
MSRVRLIRFTDEPTGETGLRLESCPPSEYLYASREGRLLAHDLLEHVNGGDSIGSIDDELEALGAAWYVRGQHGGLDRGHTLDPYDGLVNDLTGLLEEVDAGKDGPTPPRDVERRCAVLSPDFERMATEACARVRRELVNESEGDITGDFAEFAPLRMLAGYRKARRKYRDADAAYRLFWAVSDAIDAALGNEYPSRAAMFQREREPDAPAYLLTYSLAAGTASCRPLDFDEMED